MIILRNNLSHSVPPIMDGTIQRMVKISKITFAMWLKIYNKFNVTGCNWVQYLKLQLLLVIQIAVMTVDHSDHIYHM